MGWYDWDEYEYDDEYYRDDEILGDHEPTPDAIIISGPVRAISRRGDIGVEWWGQQWVATFEQLGDAGRLQRGKRYARNGSVHDLEISYGQAFARVQGSRANRYRTAVTLQVFSDEEWNRALAALAGQAIYSAKLLAGEMPADIEDVFQSVGLSLFPRSHDDVTFYCSCPDWGDPCKHAAAIYYLLAEQFDADPFTLFHLRGRSRESVLATLRAHRGVAVAAVSGDGDDDDDDEAKATMPEAPPLDADLAAFWRGSGDLNLVRTAPVIPRQAPPLRQLGDPPGGVGGELRKLYTLAAHAAYRRLGGNGWDENGTG